MGKRRIEIKKIHNKSNRQITYSKRRNGILKKSYELATLCGAEIALIMFSPSRRTLTYFTANNSIEDILTKVVDLPEQVTKGLCNKEELQMIIEKIKYDNDIASLLEKNSGNNDESIIENLQYEIQRAHDELDDTEYKLRLYEGDPIRLSSLRDVECNEQLLRETLNRVRSLRQHMDGNYLPNVQPTTPAYLQAHNANNYGFLANNPNWIPPQHQELQFMNCFDSNGLLPTRNEAITPAGFLPPAPIHGNNMNLTAHMGSGVATTSSQAHHEVFGHVNGNLPQFTEPTEVDSSSHEQQGGEPFLALRRFLDL